MEIGAFWFMFLSLSHDFVSFVLAGGFAGGRVPLTFHFDGLTIVGNTVMSSERSTRLRCPSLSSTRAAFFTEYLLAVGRHTSFSREHTQMEAWHLLAMDQLVCILRIDDRFGHQLCSSA